MACAEFLLSFYTTAFSPRRSREVLTVMLIHASYDAEQELAFDIHSIGEYISLG